MKKIYVLLSVAILSFACLTLNPNTETTITTDSAQPIEVQAGETFNIIIDSNPTTGYHWELVGELDADVLQFVSHDYKADEPVLTGSGGADVWTFTAVSAGQVQITLGSYPPSDASTPEQTVVFNIIVK